MAIMTRLLRLCKADVHGVLDQLEDKGLLLRQLLREMEAHLTHKQRQLEALNRHGERLARQVERHAAQMAALEADLHLALSSQRDDLARPLIRRRRSLATVSRWLETQGQAIAQEQARLTETLSRQRQTHETLRAKADLWALQAGAPSSVEEALERAAAVDSWDDGEAAVELELLRRKEALEKGVEPCIER